MPTWPTNSKASISNVDSGSDKPRLARLDIKQNIENTNAIIDTLHIDSPSDTNALVYNASNARFELAGQGIREAFLRLGTYSQTNGGSNGTNNDDDFDVYPIASKVDPHSLTTLSGAGRFTLIAGTYFVELYTNGPHNPGNSQSLTALALKGVDSTIVIGSTNIQAGLTFNGEFTIDSTAEFYLTPTANFGATPGNSLSVSIKGYMKLTKLG